MSLTVNMGTWLTLRHEGFGFHISSKGTFLQSQSCGCGFSDTSSSTTSSSIGRCTLGACLAGAAWDGRSPGRKCPFELLHWGGAPGLAWASAGAWSWGRTLDLEAADPPPFAAHAQRTEGRVCPRPVWRFEPETNDAPGGQLSWHNSDPAEVAYHIRQSQGHNNWQRWEWAIPYSTFERIPTGSLRSLGRNHLECDLFSSEWWEYSSATALLHHLSEADTDGVRRLHWTRFCAVIPMLCRTLREFTEQRRGCEQPLCA